MSVVERGQKQCFFLLGRGRVEKSHAKGIIEGSHGSVGSHSGFSEQRFWASGAVLLPSDHAEF
jgi:hypothetical protein